jgi:hypothetical protein
MKLEAPVGLMAGRRRPSRPGHVRVTIEDLLIATWELPEARLARLLPPGLRIWSRGGRGLVSAVLFRNRALRPAWLGFPRLACPQLNLRIYLADPAGRPGAVFFPGLFLGSRRLARWAAWITGVPFRSIAFGIQVDRTGDALSWGASSPDGAVRVVAREAPPATPIDTATLDLLTNVHTGIVRDARGRLRSWSIWHPNQVVRTMAVDEMRLAPLAEVTAEPGEPAWVFYVEAVAYEVYLPARPSA